MAQEKWKRELIEAEAWRESTNAAALDASMASSKRGQAVRVSEAAAFRKMGKKPHLPSGGEFVATLNKLSSSPKFNQFKDSCLRREGDLDIPKKRSERTTFNLTSESAKALNKLTKVFGLKFKDLFDHMIDRFTDSFFSNLPDEGINDYTKKLYQDLLKSKEFNVRKTFVLSESALKRLTSLSDFMNISRNHLINVIIRQYYNHLKEIYEVKTPKIKEYIDKLDDIYLRMEDVVFGLAGYIDNDPMMEDLISISYAFEHEIIKIEDEISKYAKLFEE